MSLGLYLVHEKDGQSPVVRSQEVGEDVLKRHREASSNPGRLGRGGGDLDLGHVFGFGLLLVDFDVPGFEGQHESVHDFGVKALARQLGDRLQGVVGGVGVLIGAGGGVAPVGG